MTIAADSIQIRRSAVGYIFQRAIELQRKDCLAFYELLSAEIGDYPEMHQDSATLTLRRHTAPDNVAEVVVNRMDALQPTGAQVPIGTRFLFAEQSSRRPASEFSANADIAFEAFQQTWGSASLGRVQGVEINIQGTLAVNHVAGAPGLIKQKFLSGATDTGHLGREFPAATIKLVSGLVVTPQPNAAPVPLPSAVIDLTIEPFNPDQRLLFFNAVFQWPTAQINLADLALPAQAREALGGRTSLELNQEMNKPSYHFDLGYNYVLKNVVPYLCSLAR